MRLRVRRTSSPETVAPQSRRGAVEGLDATVGIGDPPQEIAVAPGAAEERTDVAAGAGGAPALEAAGVSATRGVGPKKAPIVSFRPACRRRRASRRRASA